MSLIVNWKLEWNNKWNVITGIGLRVEGNQSHGSAYDLSGDGRGKFFPLD